MRLCGTRYSRQQCRSSRQSYSPQNVTKLSSGDDIVAVIAVKVAEKQVRELMCRTKKQVRSQLMAITANSRAIGVAELNALGLVLLGHAGHDAHLQCARGK